MTDYARMERHRRYYWAATWARYLAILALWPEVYVVIAYHFPVWDDVAIPVTVAVHGVGRFVQKKTAMYVE